MMNKALTYLLITMVALQSVVAIADVHQPHQKGVQHIVVDDHHHEQRKADDGSEVMLDEYDCNHCCHCHGVNFLGVSDNKHDTNPSRKHRFQNGITLYFSHIHPPSLRPPIV